MEKIEVFSAVTELLGQPNGIDKIAELQKVIVGQQSVFANLSF